MATREVVFGQDARLILHKSPKHLRVDAQHSGEGVPPALPVARYKPSAHEGYVVLRNRAMAAGRVPVAPTVHYIADGAGRHTKDLADRCGTVPAAPGHVTRPDDLDLSGGELTVGYHISHETPSRPPDQSYRRSAWHPCQTPNSTQSRGWGSAGSAHLPRPCFALCTF